MKTFVWVPEDSRASLYFSSSDKKLYLEELEVWDNEGGRIPDYAVGAINAAEQNDGLWLPLDTK